MSRTIIEFAPSTDPWPVIDAWSAANKFTLAGHGPWGRTYKRGDGFWTTMTMVQIEATPTGLRLSGWVPFWGAGPEQSLHNIDFIAYFPRRKSQRIVNALLLALGTPALT